MAEQIQSLLDKLRKSFASRKTRPVEFRKQQLKQLLKGINEMSIQLAAAAEKDLGRDPFMTEISSINPCKWEAKYALDNIDQYMKEIVKDTSLLLAPARTKIKYEPLGVVLIFGSWNYPYVVTLKPLVQCLASGNCALIKPSEMAPYCSAAIKKLVENYLDRDCYEVLEGGVEVAAQICHFPWDLICFTGSTLKGKLVAEAAAKNLVPCILELGGKCPCVVDETADIDYAAAKVCMARFTNSGQTCISTDYVMVHESQKKLFVEKIQQKIKLFFGEHVNGSPEMGKMINEWHCGRVQDLIKSSGGEIVTGGRVDKDIKYVEPTVVVDPKLESDIMNEEIFGPVLPIVSFNDISTVIKHINSKDKPLAVYYFGKVLSNNNMNRLMEETSSGQFVVNEVLMQMANHEFGFGGVGASGYGRYGGYEGFKQFSNAKSVMIKPTMNFAPFNTIVPPFTPQKKIKILKLVETQGTQMQIVRYIFYFLAALTLLIYGLYLR